jgi:hypothetical protein
VCMCVSVVLDSLIRLSWVIGFGVSSLVLLPVSIELLSGVASLEREGSKAAELFLQVY